MTTRVPATHQSKLTVPPQPGVSVLGRRLPFMGTLWAWPLLLSLLFVAVVMVWMTMLERDEREERRNAMISDALSLDSYMSNALDAETMRLQSLARLLEREKLSPETFSRHAWVLDGLRRMWITVTWIDAKGRIVVQFPDEAVLPQTVREQGLTGHINTPLKDGGLLIARYSSARLLRQQVPWWLASKYDIRLVDSADNVLATTTDVMRQADQLWYRKAMGAALPDVWLELAARERVKPWWRSLPMVLMMGFVWLLGLASWMLRRQMRGVAKAEAAWRTEAAWRSAMEDSLAVGIRARDLDGRLVYVNKTMADMIGYSQEELIGAMPPMPYWVKGELDLAMQRHQRNMAGHAPREGYETHWQHRNGAHLDVMVFEAPLVDAKGQHIGWMASILNITERRQMEERERKQADTMAHQARLTMLGEVASTLAHELNQPLSVIASYNAGLINMVGQQASPDAEVLDALKRMGEQATHAGRIVRRIRDFLTRHEPQLETFDIKPVLLASKALLQRDVTRRQIQVTMQFAPDLPLVHADPVLIEQVAINLIKNACDAVGDQPEPRRVHVQVQASSDGRFVKVLVKDNGPGLQGKTIETLCAPFYSNKQDGMGMGLAICRSIIELHWGVLDAQDSPEGGAVFTFSVPSERIAS